MVLIRKTVAILALPALGGLIVTLERGSYGVNLRLVAVTQVLLVPLVLTMIGSCWRRHGADGWRSPAPWQCSRGPSS